MKEHDVRFQAPLGGPLPVARTNAFFLGGGKALMNAYYAAAQRLGVGILYDAEVVDIEMRGGRFASATVRHGGSDHRVAARTCVAAAGGFESRPEARRGAR